MTVRSAGILLWRKPPGLQLLLGHMGGPFWAKKDARAWSIPKGLYQSDEDPLSAARREFAEEIGVPAPAADYVPLGEFRQASGKRLTVFAAQHDLHLDQVVSNTFPLEWPPHSGRIQEFPEIDAAGWFDLPVAREKAVKGQLPVLDALERLCDAG